MAVIEGSAPPVISRKRAKKLRRPDLASQWQLMWWKFRRHKMAVFGLVVLGLLLACALFAEFIGPYPPGQRDTRYVLGPPMLPQMVDAAGNFHLRPFVYGVKPVRDMVTLRMTYERDTTEIWEIGLFVIGEPYKRRGSSISSVPTPPASTSSRARFTRRAPRSGLLSSASPSRSCSVRPSAGRPAISAARSTTS
jgi:hypothetical protein